ncbi:creatinine amidohydrolase [Sphingobium sp. B1D7B]|uniref:creatininase family protein n=1 Tax=unclassified Sphingobium TaxID=2611147 RepID=UPI002225405E|nr:MULTISPECIES: creatininase family protein [unclassified Sphingobium]MCW2393097.1 creatinine amidohydrolase [Sphingobium sp. B11D3A]MCW2404902.1 creatinine amidohydrolase [Sphingobium sp. B1D7B]
MLEYWQDMTTRDFQSVDAARDIALMPVAAIEQHGPHLPVSVDADINAGVVAAAARHLADGVRVVALPMLAIGKSNEHMAFPGTLTVGAETLLRYWIDIAESVLRAGFRKIVVLNSHGGQPQLVEILVRELRVRHGALAVSASTYGFGVPEGLFSEDELHHGIHAGAVESSMMLHLRPDQVKRELMADFPSTGPAIARDYDELRLEGAVGMGWMTQDINPDGAIGNASLANADHGAQCLDHAGRGLARLLADVSRYPLPESRA